MTSPASPRAQILPGDDELDDILNGLVEGRDVPNTSNIQAQPQPRSQGPSTSGDGLGIDEEIIITKKRIPIPKLDDNRLLSDPGIPRLRKISKERLRFKGKGHEYGDIARMLNMYQLWLDDLYPRAKFADALTILEKVGHTKRMQLMRKDWIDEGKSRRNVGQDDDAVEDIVSEITFGDDADKSMDDSEQKRETEDAQSGPGAYVQDDPDEDELDALLAESEYPRASTTVALPTRIADTDNDPFADEMEAMADMEDMW